MPGAYYPNREPWCELECGCITGMEFAIRWIGDKERGRKWWQFCLTTGELEKVVTERFVGRLDGKCKNADRLF